MFSALFLLLIPSNFGFLLNEPSNWTSTNNQFITHSEFVNEKHLLQRETDSLRHDVDMTMASLTAQLKQKFSELENRIQTATQTSTSGGCNSCVPLNKYQELEVKYAKLQNLTHNLKLENQRLNSGLDSLRNKTTKDIAALQNLRTLRPVFDLATLQKLVQENTQSLQFLKANEQARGQDFIALHKMLSNVEKTILAANSTLNSTIKRLEELSQSMNSYAEQVALMAFPTSSSVTGSCVKFDNINYSVGVKNPTSMKSSGKFVCEKEGLYLIAVSIASKDQYPYFCTMKNAIELSCTDVGQTSSSSSELWKSGSSIIVNHLSVNDEVWIRPDQLKSIETENWSQISIVKIK